jgi:antitoxin ParD1/3/4
MPNTVNLGRHYEQFVEAQVGSGRFTNVSEVIRAGLRLLEEQEEARQLKLAELRRLIEEGIASGGHEPLDLDAIFEEATAQRVKP